MIIEKIKNYELINSAMQVVNTLISNNYKCYFVGGFVRDLIMDRNIKEIDICTNAYPEQIVNLFKRTVKVGIKFGIVLVLIGNSSFEVATFRKDFDYNDGRHPTKVIFTDEKEDVFRRDFTINGLLYDPQKDIIIDYVGGQNDIKNKVIKSIGNSYDRFNEDKLRILRGIRFACTLDFKIDEKTMEAMKFHSKNIEQISIERISNELQKILISIKPKYGIELLENTELLEYILPEFLKLRGIEQPKEFHPEGDVYEHTLLMLENMKNQSFELAFAVLLHDIGKPDTMTYPSPDNKNDRIRFNNHEKVGSKIALNICKRFKLSNEQTSKIVKLVEEHMRFKDAKKMKEAKLIKFLRQDFFEEHLELHRLDCIASHGMLDVYNFCLEKLKYYNDKEKETGNNFLKPKKIIDGKDLIELGYLPSPLFKKMLDEIEEKQLEKEILTKEDAIKFININFPIN